MRGVCGSLLGKALFFGSLDGYDGMLNSVMISLGIDTIHLHPRSTSGEGSIDFRSTIEPRLRGHPTVAVAYESLVGA